MMLADAPWVDFDGEGVEKVEPKTNDELKDLISKIQI